MANNQPGRKALAYAGMVVGVLIMIFALTQAASRTIAYFETQEPPLIRVWVFVATIGACTFVMGKLSLRRLSRVNAREKARIAVKEVALYTKMDSRSPLIAQLVEGNEVIVGLLKEVDGVDRTKLTLNDGRSGFVIGRETVCTTLTARMVDEAPVRIGSPKGAEYLMRSGDELEIAKSDWDDAPVGETTYVKAWLPNGERVFIRNNNKVRWL